MRAKPVPPLASPPSEVGFTSCSVSAAMAAMLVLVTGLVYAPAIHGAWLWDDNSEITTHLELRGPWWKIWTSPSGPDFLPLKSTMQWIEWRLFGAENTTGYHFASIGLHALSAFLLWRLFQRLGLRFAWLGALLFAVHPLAVESVAWVAELKNTLSLPAFLCAALAWIEFERSRKSSAYAQTLGWFIAALLCKGSVVTLPVMLLFYGWWKRKKFDRRDFIALAPLLGLSLVASGVTIWFQSHHTGWSIELGSFFSRIALIGSTVGFYVGKLFWPFGLLPVYPAWVIDLAAPRAWLPLVGMVLAMIITWSFRRSWGGSLAFALGCISAALLPVLGLIPMAYFQLSWVADHLAYLALVPALGLAVGAADSVTRRWSKKARALEVMLIVTVAGVLLWQARRYAGVYKNSEALWSYATEHDPHSWLALNNLGVVRLEQERWADALDLFERSLALKPDFSPTHSNAANALAHLRRPAEAVAGYQRALQIDPDNVDANYNFANVLVELGEFGTSINYYTAALRSAPDSVDARFNLAKALMHLERWDAAAEQFTQVLRLHPDSSEARIGWGNVLASAGKMTEAVAQFQLAVTAQPASVEAQYCLADAETQLGRLTEASEHYQVALQLAPTRADIRLAYAEALWLGHRAAESATEFSTVLISQPDNPDAKRGLERVRLAR